MSHLISFGEALIDWIPLGVQQEGPLEIPLYGQFPGGAPANVAVALARLAGEAYFLGKTGLDPAGSFLRKSLNTYKVHTDFLLDDPAPTPMSFVSLDERGEREFSFHRSNTADMQYRTSDFPVKLFNDAIFHICSNTLTTETLKQTTLSGLQLARKQSCLTSFDVNLRFPLWDEPLLAKPAVEEALQLSDIVKFSLEELQFLAGDIDEADYVQQLLNNGSRIVLLTDGAEAIKIYFSDQQLVINTPTVEVVDTTGAGDAFVGGWLFSLLNDQITNYETLDNAIDAGTPLRRAADYAVQCGAFAVTRRGAWTALPQQNDIAK